MEIYQLRAFATAARLGSLTRTAEALHLTQPAITAQIKALEEDLGVSLFDRRPGGIALTRAGELLLQDAEQILTAAGHLQGKARELQGEVTGELVLGTLADPETLRLGSLLSALAEKLPLLGIKSPPRGQSPWPQRPSQCWRMQRSRAAMFMPEWSRQLRRLALGSALGLALER